MVEPDEVEDAVVAELGVERAVRRALPRERRPRAADPARLPRQAHAAVAAAAEVAVAARGRQALRRLPDHPRDLPRVPARRARPARPAGAADRAAPPRAQRRRGRDADRLAVRRSLLFDYVATYMYEGDTPNAERRAAALSLDRDLLRELLGQEELRDLIDPGALDQVEADLQHRSDRTQGRLARRAGRRAAPPRRPDARRGARPRPRRARRRAAAARARRGAPRGAAAHRRRAALDRRRRRRPVPRRARRRPAERPARGVRRRRAPTRWRSSSRATRARTARSRPTSCAPATASIRPRSSRSSSARASSSAASCGPGGTQREWCDADVLRRLRRASLAVLRKEIEASDQRALAAFLPSWQGVDRHPGRGRRRRPPARGARRRCRASRCPPTCGSATCCRGAPAPTRRRGWTSCAPAARSSGSAPARSGATPGGSRSTSATTPS